MDKLNTIIQKIFRVKPEEINDEMSPQTVPDWDSMNYLLLIAEIEKEFNVTFTVSEVLEARNLGDIKKYLRERGVQS